MPKTPKIAVIEEIIDENKEIKTFSLKEIEEDRSKTCRTSKPGQFVLLWVPETIDKNYESEIPDQLPMSISGCDNDLIKLTIKKITNGTTEELHRYKKGMHLGIIGPLGKPFTVNGDKILLVGGGTGLAPLRFLSKKLSSRDREIYCVMGAKNKEEVIFADEMKRYCKEVIITTDDGSAGIKGFASDPVEELCKSKNIDQIYCCGPEIMMKKVLEKALKLGIPAEFSLERYMYCGLGLCGFCNADGYLVCKDGPIFSSEKLKNIKDFGGQVRSEDGVMKKL